jgi:ATP-dependent Zn protease
LSTNLRAIAFHEAGHAVADLKFGFILNGTTINSNKKQHLLGHAQSLDGEDYIKPDGSIDKKRAGEAVTSWLAGYAAEIHCDPTSKAQAAINASDDFQKATDILTRLGQPSVFAFWQQRARDLVKNHWKAIEMVARDLLEVKKLDGDEVTLIFEIAEGNEGSAQGLGTHREGIKEHLVAWRGRAHTSQFPFRKRPGA